MRKSIFTLVLAIAAGVWTLSNAMCMGPFSDAMDQPYTTVSGTIQALPFPCEPGEDCPTCLTEAIVTNDKTYYLTTKNQQVADFLEQIQTSPVPAIYLLPLKATASGTPYQIGSFDYLLISSLNELSVEYFSDQQENKLPSLSDEWNVLEISNVTCGYCEEYRTYNFHLTTDTVIGGLLYSQLIKDGAYKGALREGNNRDIYCVPAGCSQEYLLYAFNAQVGDSLKNIWVGGNSSWIPDVRSAIVSEIKQTTPRTIELEVHYYEAPDAYEESIRNLTWIEGIGMPFGPMGAECSVFNGCADSKAKLLLCAYKNGEQVYVSDWGEQYGCEYNRHTIPSLCDEWNVLYEPFSWPGGYNTFKYYLSTDTIINGKQYVKLASDKDYPYCGAFREDNNANIYYIPSGSTHEYLIYAFNAQVGDTLVNLWVGGFGEDYQGVVQAISNGSPRIFIIGVKFYENTEYYSPIRWIEGVGSPETPMGLAVVPTVPADIGVFNLLCAYKNGQQVYATQLSEQFGCFYEGHNPPPTTDTIPLYAQDDPGSSTVDPVDPNQVVVTLKGDELTIRDNSGEEIMMALSLSEGEASVPAFNRVQRTQSFRNELTVTLTEEGLYRLELSNPSWGYNIFGTFNYPQRKDAIDQTLVVPAAQKILRNGQLLIRIGDKVYTVHGTEIGD